MSSTRNIALSTFWQILSQAAMALLSILATKFVAVGLSKELAGYYNSSYGFLQTFAVIADFGLYAVSVREVSKVRGEERERVFGSLLVLRMGILLLSLGSAIGLVWLTPSWRATPFPLAVTVAALVPFFTLLAGMFRTIFQVEYRMEFVFVAEVLQRIITTAGIGWFILRGIRLTDDPGILQAFLWIGGEGALVLLLISLISARRFLRLRLTFDPTLLKKFALLAAPYGMAYLLMAMYRQLDVVFITILRPDFALQNAYYGFAGRVEDMAFIIPTFLLNSTLPILTMRLHEKKDVSSLLGKTLLILLITGSTFFLFSVLWAKPFTLLFATRLYLSTPGVPGSDVAFGLMSIPMFLNGLILFSFYTFLAQHAWKRLTVTFGIGVVLTIIGNLLWTKTLGFVGAGLSLTVVHCILTVLLLPQVLRSLKVRLTFMEILRWLGYSVILGLILFELSPLLTTSVRTLIAGSLMIPVLAVLGFLLGFHRSLTFSEQPSADPDIETTMF